MTREEAKREILFAKRQVMADSYIDKTYDMAIKALEQPEQKVGKWIEHKWAEEAGGFLISNYECSHCHSWERKKSYYCPNCGAKMEGQDG